MPLVLNKQQMSKIIDFVKERHKSSDLNHMMDHIELTAKLARYLAVGEDADEEICIAAAHLHDIAKGNLSPTKEDFTRFNDSPDGHGCTGAEQAREFLRAIGAPEPFIGQVTYAVAQHDNDLPKKTKEAEVLWDADKLQLIGPLGFTRIFSYHLIYGEMDIRSAIAEAAEYEDFFYKRFYTSTGREIARDLHDFMKEFHKLYDTAINVKFEEIQPAKQDLIKPISMGEVYQR